MKLLNKVEDKLNGRTSYVYELVKKTVTPSRVELQKEIAKKEKAKPELTVVEKINVAYGTNVFTIEATIYDNKDDYKRLVPEYLAKKSVLPEEPKEEAKEESKEEAKKEIAAPAEEATAEKGE